MQGKIGLEEHFAIQETLGDSKGYLPDSTWPELQSRILDMQERRIAEMDRHGMQMMILSLNAPAIQAIPDAKRATEVARRANDFLAAEAAKRPSRL
jgi:gamma-resorcylate decarboxylase